MKTLKKEIAELNQYSIMILLNSLTSTGMAVQLYPVINYTWLSKGFEVAGNWILY